MGQQVGFSDTEQHPESRLLLQAVLDHSCVRICGTSCLSCYLRDCTANEQNVLTTFSVMKITCERLGEAMDELCQKHKIADVTKGD